MGKGTSCPFILSTESMVTALYMYRRILMQERAICYSNLGKPSKYEQVSGEYRWSTNNTFLDSDKKRTTACKNPKINKLKK